MKPISALQRLGYDLEELYTELFVAANGLAKIADQLRWMHSDVVNFRGSFLHLRELSDEQRTSICKQLDYSASTSGEGSHRIRHANERLLEFVRYHVGVSEHTVRMRSEELGLAYRIRESEYLGLSAKCKTIYDMSTTPVRFPARSELPGRLFLAPGDPLRHLASKIRLDLMDIKNPFVVVMHGTASGTGVGFLNADRTSTSISAEEHAALLRCDPAFDSSKTIWLVSCNTGNEDQARALGIDPYGQQLADVAGVEVVAPTRVAWLDSNGDAAVCGLSHREILDAEGTRHQEAVPTWSDPGSWKRFYPRTALQSRGQ